MEAFICIKEAILSPNKKKKKENLTNSSLFLSVLHTVRYMFHERGHGGADVLDYSCCSRQPQVTVRNLNEQPHVP